MKILMVCLGNICRSPMAEGILSKMAGEAKLGWQVDSAGTGSWHVGEQPDPRAMATCAARNLDISYQRARRVRQEDLDDFDLILTMDESNYEVVLRMARSKDHLRKVKMLASYSDDGITEVPDPYYDGSFDAVYALLEDLCRRVVDAHRTK